MKTILMLALISLPLSSYAVIFAQKKEEKPQKEEQLQYDAPPVTAVTASDVTNCEDGDYVSQALLRQIVPNFNEIQIRFVDKNKTTAKIIFPKYLSTCMDLKISYKKVGNDIFLVAKNEYKFDSKKYPQATTNQKYEACLRKNGALQNDGRIVGGQYSGGFVQAFDVSYEKKNDVKIHFASPSAQASDYAPVFSAKAVSATPDSCLKGEELTEGGFTLYKSPYKTGLDHYQATCDSGDHKAIYEALKDLKESETGNAKALTKEAREALSQVLQAQLDKTISEKQGEWMARLKELNDEIKKTKDRDVLESLSEEYVDLIQTIDKFVLSPRIDTLVALYAKRKASKDKEEKKALDKEIKVLNDFIGAFGRKKTYVSTEAINKIMEAGLKDQADLAYAFKLRSLHFAEVNFGAPREGYPKDPAKVKIAMENKMKDFDEASTEKEREYNVSMGYESYSKEYAERARSAMSRRELTLEKDKTRLGYKKAEISKYCKRTFWGGVSNKAKCSSAQSEYSNMVKSAERRYARYNKDITKFSGRAEKYYSLEQKYKSALAEDSDEISYNFDDFSFYSGETYSSQDFDIFSQMLQSSQQGLAMPGSALMGGGGLPMYLGGGPNTMNSLYASPYGSNGLISPIMSPPMYYSTPNGQGFSFGFGAR